jgi:hypothetical protein
MDSARLAPAERAMKARRKQAVLLSLLAAGSILDEVAF